MSFQNIFATTDTLVNHFNSISSTIADQSMLTHYAGIIAVNGTTAYELAIKDIFINFASKKNSVFGTFTINYFDRLNGRIIISELKDNQIKRFGPKYMNKFDAILSRNENLILKKSKTSITACYNNLILSRHNYVHKGASTLTISEAINCYQFGKEVINCLFKSMRG